MSTTKQAKINVELRYLTDDKKRALTLNQLRLTLNGDNYVSTKKQAKINVELRYLPSVQSGDYTARENLRIVLSYRTAFV